ncbi:hypothetical protein EGH24_07180 [Halonotius terrestris]|uniref:LWR-salt protein n=1 Tax=Halonotius terrestris TaxID=2487750 RepID=A0A8J8TCJ3_9EURY|nr:LWR-salt protein [Halonotius terrestris]TQQ80931.1 hypothetical protein EGH24_07180 [Halonotius terrestris]
MNASYVFRVTFRLDPSDAHVDPDTFETVLRIPAEPPGADGWLFFQQHLWRGDVADAEHMRRVAADRLAVDVVSISFSELATDEAYLTALKTTIEADLARFNADSVDEVLHQHFGSSIHVRDDGFDTE